MLVGPEVTGYMMVDSPVADSPVEDSPVEDSPVEDSPVEDSPVEDSPDLDFHSDLPIHRLVDQTGLVDNRVAPFKGFSQLKGLIKVMIKFAQLF